MFSLIIVTHGKLAREFVNAMEHVLGPQEKVFDFCIEPEHDIEQKREELIALVNKQDTDGGTIVLTDMFGGTPSNLALSLLDITNVEVIAGVNLPMLIKLGSIRDKVGLASAVTQAQEAAKNYINVARQLLEKVS